jgi:hypothetical protein
MEADLKAVDLIAGEVDLIAIPGWQLWVKALFRLALCACSGCGPEADLHPSVVSIREKVHGVLEQWTGFESDQLRLRAVFEGLIQDRKVWSIVRFEADGVVCLVVDPAIAAALFQVDADRRGEGG